VNFKTSGCADPPKENDDDHLRTLNLDPYRHSVASVVFIYHLAASHTNDLGRLLLHASNYQSILHVATVAPVNREIIRSKTYGC
jgi:hypothetical protein